MLATLAMLAGVAGCGSNEPTAPAPAHHALNVRVRDAHDAPAVHAVVYAVGPGPEDVFTVLTDTSGTARFSVVAGPWTVYASGGTGGPAQVAGGTGNVPEQGDPDSVLFRLQLASESLASGQVLLTGRTSHGQSTVGIFDLPLATQTLPDGSWRLDGLPPGHWLAFAAHTGFQDATFPLVNPAPGDTLLFRDPITLLPAPTP